MDAFVKLLNNDVDILKYRTVKGIYYCQASVLTEKCIHSLAKFIK